MSGDGSRRRYATASRHGDTSKSRRARTYDELTTVDVMESEEMDRDA
jgi:hypothetical protein